MLETLSFSFGKAQAFFVAGAGLFGPAPPRKKRETQQNGKISVSPKNKDNMLRPLAWCAALAMAAVWLLILYFAVPVVVSGQATQVLSWVWAPEQGHFGILPMFTASLLLSLSALFLAWPLALGIACALQLGGHAARSWLLGGIRFMTCIPTVVWGFASVFLLVPLVREAWGRGSGLCWLSAMLVLALLTLPTMVLVLDAALGATNRRTSLTMAAMGFSPEQNLAFVVLPTSRHWLFRAGILGFGRAVGDTLIPLMLSGNAPHVPDSLFASLRTLSAHMALVTATEAGSAAYNSLFMAAALLLLTSVGVSTTLRRIAGNTPEITVLTTPRITPGLVVFPRLPRLLRWWAGAATALVASALGVLCLFLLWRGVPALNSTLFFGTTPPLAAITGQAPVWEGIWPAFVGTLALLFLTMLLALGPGLSCGIYLTEYAPPRVRAAFSLVVDTMAGMPSIVMGVFGFLLILLLRRTVWPSAQPSLLLAALCMALLVLPVLIVATRNALESLPHSLRISAYALGFSRSQVLWRILLPQASTGILGGCMLAMGRAAEDTAVILLTGVVANAGLPSGLGIRFEALPFMIYYTAAQYQDAAELARGFGAALVLLGLSCLLLFFAHRTQQRYLRRHTQGNNPCR